MKTALTADDVLMIWFREAFERMPPKAKHGFIADVLEQAERSKKVVRLGASLTERRAVEEAASRFSERAAKELRK